jgi:ATP-dependent Lhr-like helicase
VVAEAQPAIRDADELHDVLLSRLVLPEFEDTEHKAWFAQLVGDGRATTFVRHDGRTAWTSVERWPAACAVYQGIIPHPPVAVPMTVPQEWTSIDARLAMVRGFMEVSGPVTVSELANELALEESQVDASLHALEGEGTVLRGRFSPHVADGPSPTVEWCHRRILARIHRETVLGLRREIEPVGVDVFIRFLARHHGLAKDSRRAGPNGLFEVIGVLQGFDIPAVAWERDILPLRVEGYRPEWLDELCLTGEVTWGRLYPSRKNPNKSRPMSSMTKSIPVGLLLREDAAWLGSSRTGPREEPLSSPAAHVFEVLNERGAMFASDLAQATQMLPAQLPDVLGELVARGRVTADGFSGLRQLIEGTAIPTRRASQRRFTRERQSQSVGRWSVWNVFDGSAASLSSKEIAEQWAWQFLRRWGVVFRDLLIREAGAPRWFELLQIYRRMEARGELRGGRFITGVSGEQFALGETVRQLRQLRDQECSEEYLVLSAADPLNLVGVLTPHPRVPSMASHRVLYRNGVPLAWRRRQCVEMFDAQVEPGPVIQSLLHGRLGLHSAPTESPNNRKPKTETTHPKSTRLKDRRLF